MGATARDAGRVSTRRQRAQAMTSRPAVSTAALISADGR
jgi:hypothetical protein